MRVVWISDLDVKGSGYANLSVPLCVGLHNKGHEIKILGLGYRGEEHQYPLSIIPAQNFQEIFAMLQNLSNMWPFDVLVVALDIPLQEQILHRVQQRPFKYVGIMPIEADPLCASWAMVLMWMDKAFIISEFGTEEAHKAGVATAEHIPIGLDTEQWRLPTLEERTKVRESLFGVDDECFVILTVADNQERKNLAAGMEIFAKFNKEVPNSKYVLVTREHNMVGWKLRDYAATLGINNNLLIFERGMNFEQLWSIYAGADCFLMASKAEGLCCLPDTEVWTLNGKKPINQIKVTDMVVSHTGDLKSVSETHKRFYAGNVCELSLPYGLSSIKVTPNHRVLSAKKSIGGGHGKHRIGSVGWFPADVLRPGDYVFYPKQNFSQEQLIDLTDYLDNDQIYFDDLIVSSLGKNQFGSKHRHPVSKSLPRHLSMSRELMQLIGYYVSEGCQIDDGLSFSFHSDETDLQQEVMDSMRYVFGLDIKVDYNDRHRCQMWVYHSLLGRFFGEMCGKSSHHKKLPDWALWLPDNLLSELLRAMFLGDGTYSKFGQRTMRYSTVSKELAEQIQFVLTRFGILSSLKSGKDRIEYTVTIHHPDLYKVPFYLDDLPDIKKKSSKRVDYKDDLMDGFFVPIKSVQSYLYSGFVYNLDVDEDNSYLTSGGVVHNCMPLLEAMAVGLPCIATNATGMRELLKDGRGYLVPNEYLHIDPFGNGHRYWIDKDKVVYVLMNMRHSIQQVLDYMTNSRAYVKQRTWDKAVEVLENGLKGVTGK